MTFEIKNISVDPIHNIKDNLTKAEKSSLRNLMARDDIIITNADKGGTVVIIDIHEYIKEANRQLNDTEYYCILTHNPTYQHADIIKSTINQLSQKSLSPQKWVIP